VEAAANEEEEAGGRRSVADSCTGGWGWLSARTVRIRLGSAARTRYPARPAPARTIHPTLSPMPTLAARASPNARAGLKAYRNAAVERGRRALAMAEQTSAGGKGLDFRASQ